MSTSSISAFGSLGASSWSDYRKQLFAKIDADGDGKVDKTELEKAFTDQGGTAAQADALFAKLDVNNTGSLTEEQFDKPPQDDKSASSDSSSSSSSTSTGASLSQLSDELQSFLLQLQSLVTALDQASSGSDSSSTSTDGTSAIFQQADANGDGVVTKDELQSLQASQGMTDPNFDEMFAQVDTNGDGEISADEDKAFMAKMAQNGPPPPPPQDAGSTDSAGAAGGSGGGSSSTQFDPADTNQDGVVSTAEQQAYDLAHGIVDTTTTSATDQTSTDAQSIQAMEKKIQDLLKQLDQYVDGSGNNLVTGRTLNHLLSLQNSSSILSAA